MEQLKLNMIPNGVNPVFHASQYDKGRQIRFVLDETLSGAEVTVSYRAKDGTEHGNVQTSVSGNTITDTIPEEVLTDYGIVEGEVRIDGIGSLNFFVEVEKDAYDGGDIITQTASGAIATFETNIETAFASLTADINPVQSGTGTPSPQNVRPISGFSALNVVGGKNLWNSDLCIEAYLDGNGQAVANAANITQDFGYYCKANQSITISANTTIYNIGYCVIRASDGVVTSRVNNNNISTVTVTPTENSYIKVWISKDNQSLGTLEQAKAWAKSAEIQIEFGTSRTTYGGEVIINIPFGQTVYGGVADVTNGKVTITHGFVDLGSLTWVKDTTSLPITVFRAIISDRKAGSTDFICTNYEHMSGTRDDLRTNNNAIASWNTTTSLYVAIRDDNLSSGDATAFKTAMSGVMLCYELETPIEITTTPENLTALSGQTNNVYGDTNGDTEVEYYIEV